MTLLMHLVLLMLLMLHLALLLNDLLLLLLRVLLLGLRLLMRLLVRLRRRRRGVLLDRRGFEQRPPDGVEPPLDIGREAAVVLDEGPSPRVRRQWGHFGGGDSDTAFSSFWQLTKSFDFQLIRRFQQTLQHQNAHLKKKKPSQRILQKLNL